MYNRYARPDRNETARRVGDRSNSEKNYYKTVGLTRKNISLKMRFIAKWIWFRASSELHNSSTTSKLEKPFKIAW